MGEGLVGGLALLWRLGKVGRDVPQCGLMIKVVAVQCFERK